MYIIKPSHDSDSAPTYNPEKRKNTLINKYFNKIFDQLSFNIFIQKINILLLIVNTFFILTYANL